MAKFDSFDDLPWLKEDMIPVLDQAFPNSKFIYLTRDENSWQKSFGNWTFKMTGVYPYIEKGLSEYRNHKEYFLKYFDNRPEQGFLIFDVQDEFGFKKLAEFLGKTAGADKLPHFNMTNSKPELV
ncbi:MAG: sulfotransferase [Rhodothermales bacterium]